MKSLAELNAIREKMQKTIGIREESGDHIRIAVGMATCGIAAGARPVLQAFLSEVEKRGLTNVAVTQTGCIGYCKFEPLVEIIEPNKGKTTYVNVTPEMVPRIVCDHIVNGNPVTEYTIGAVKE